jgi:hypothetical protein
LSLTSFQIVFLVSISLHHIINDSFLDYRALYKNVLNSYSYILNSLWPMLGSLNNLKVHNKLNIKDFLTKSSNCVLMYEIIINMSLFLSFTKYKLELTIIENLKMAKMCSIIYDTFQNVPPSVLSSLIPKMETDFKGMIILSFHFHISQLLGMCLSFAIPQPKISNVKSLLGCSSLVLVH